MRRRDVRLVVAVVGGIVTVLVQCALVVVIELVMAVAVIGLLRIRDGNIFERMRVRARTQRVVGQGGRARECQYRMRKHEQPD